MGFLPWKNKLFLTILGLSWTVALKYCINSGENLAYTNSIISFILWVLVTYFCIKLTEGEYWERVKGLLNPCFILLFCFMGAMACGVQLDQKGKVSFGDFQIWAGVLVLAVGSAPFLAYVLGKLIDRAQREECPSNVVDENAKYFLIVWLILVLAYIPTLLASWPGFFTYDAEAETYMVFTEKYSAHHPIVHVVLLGWIIRIVNRLTGSYDVGIAVYMLLQMTVVSGCLAYMICFLRRIGVKRWIRNVSIAFLMLFPTISMFMCCSTKDVYFTGGIVLFTTLLLEMAREEEKFWKSRRHVMLLFFASLLILFFRNNGIYAYILFLILVVFVYRKHWKYWLRSAGIALLTYWVVTAGLTALFNVKSGEIAEMLCVPMQQLARVHAEAKETFTDEDIEVLYTLIPEVILDNYHPKLADNVKVNFLEDNFKSDPGKYISLWFRTLLKRPDIYINSFLANTYGYWYPDTVLDGYTGKWIVDREYGDSSYFAFVTERPGIRNSLIPELEKFYEKVSLEIYQQKVPVLSMVFSIGFWHWIYIFTAVFLLFAKYKKQAFAFAFIGLVYLTVLLGPIALVRYVLYLFFCAPFILALIFDTKTFAEEKSVTSSN